LKKAYGYEINDRGEIGGEKIGKKIGIKILEGD